MTRNEFFGSKLNTTLLLILIILMIFALRVMYQDREVYLHPLTPIDIHVTTPQPVPQQSQSAQEKISGHAEDLVSFSVKPGDHVSGILNFTGSVKGGYFFEG